MNPKTQRQNFAKKKNARKKKSGRRKKRRRRQHPIEKSPKPPKTPPATLHQFTSLAGHRIFPKSLLPTISSVPALLIYPKQAATSHPGRNTKSNTQRPPNPSHLPSNLHPAPCLLLMPHHPPPQKLAVRLILANANHPPSTLLALGPRNAPAQMPVQAVTLVLVVR